MNHWILMFRPETYENVKAHETIGVTGTHHKRIAEIQPGDRFVTYVSRKRLLDGHGRFTGSAFADTTPADGQYSGNLGENAGGGGSLPFTGMDLLALTAVGTVLIAGGAGLRAASRR